MNNMGGLLQQAQQMQRKMLEIEKKLSEMEVSGEVSNGLVKVTMTGKGVVKSIKIVLRKAIKYGGTSIKNYKTLDGNSGYFTQKLSVYGLDKCKCGEKIKNVKISGRSSFYCPKCQK